MRPVVLSKMITGEATALGELHELETVPIELLQRDTRDPLDVVENSEFDGHRASLSITSNPRGGQRVRHQSLACVVFVSGRHCALSHCSKCPLYFGNGHCWCAALSRAV